MKTAPLYRVQFDRVMRWYTRFAALNAGIPHDKESENYLDEIYAFFLNSYHLKDWIMNDDTVPPATQALVEEFISTTYSLALCADICNSLKHLRLKRSRSGTAPAFGAKKFSLHLGPGIPRSISLKYEVVTDRGALDAFGLATDCVRAWKSFLHSNRLL